MIRKMTVIFPFKIKGKGILPGLGQLFKKNFIEAPYIMSITGGTGTLKTTICLSFMDKMLEETKNSTVVYATFEQTERSLKKAIKNMEFTKELSKGEKAGFEIWDIGKMVKENKERFKIVKKIMKKHHGKTYKELKKVIDKQFSKESDESFKKFVLLKKAYELVIVELGKKGSELKPEQARNMLRKEGVPHEYVVKVWPLESKEPVEPKATIDYPEMIKANIIEQYKENEGDNFRVLCIDSLHALYMKMVEEMHERNVPNPETKVRHELIKLMRDLEDYDLITFIIAEAGELDKKLLLKQEFLSDGIIHLARTKKGERTIMIKKMREMGHEHGEYALKIKSTDDDKKIASIKIMGSL
ncbi:MAG: ATPase domain-containing protein [Candidatus Undinarchaeales archaeon]